MTLIVDSRSVKAASTVGKDSRGYDAGKKTFDAEESSSCQGQLDFSRCGEGDVLVEVRAPGEAVVEAADHAAEEVALGGGVPVAGRAAAPVVGPDPG